MECHNDILIFTLVKRLKLLLFNCTIEIILMYFPSKRGHYDSFPDFTPSSDVVQLVGLKNLKKIQAETRLLTFCLHFIGWENLNLI